jgi:bifunctional UDP-N-acetylglucosamine pyrophosphorylase / glucosamine-1-phosphate N-acetyltransferase
MKQIWAVVLAAGEGKRMHSDIPKVLHPLCGRPMLEYILNSAAELTAKIVIVVGHGATRVRETIGENRLYALQDQQLGTGHAVKQALSRLPDEGTLLVLCGDTPLLTAEHLKALTAKCEQGAAAVATVKLDDPTGYGRIIRGDQGFVERIVEEKDATAEEKLTTEINTGTYCFDLKLLRHCLPLLNNKNAQQEYYLTDVISMLRNSGYPVKAVELSDYRHGLGINNRVQLAEASELMRERINHQLMLSGVTIEDPRTTYIDHDVSVGRDTTLRPLTHLEAGTSIGSGCTIGPGAHLKGAEIGDKVVIEHSYLEGAKIEPDRKIGPYEVIRL